MISWEVLTMKRGKYIVTCPVCGKALFKSASEVGCMIEVQCAKCGSTLTVKLNDYTLSVRESVLEYETSCSN